MSIHEKYISGKINGWAGEDLARREFDIVGGNEFKLNVVGKSFAGKRMMLYEIVRKVLGKDTPNYAQIRGSCVSFGAKNATEYSQAADILIRNSNEKFKFIFPPYYYGCGRIFIGKNQLGRQDGSVGIWQAQAANQYGALATDIDGVPKYDGTVEYEWGNNPGPPTKFVDISKQHIVKTIARVNSWDDAVTAISNGCAITIASNQGFSMSPGSDGFHRAQGSWNHQMCLIGVDDASSHGSYGLILNSWADIMGSLKDFETGEDIPVGTIRAHAEVIDSMIRQGDSWAYSAWDGFPDLNNIIERKLFDIIGD